MSPYDLAARAVMREVCPMGIKEFMRRLPQRPDWQARIDVRIREYQEAQG